MSAYKQGGFGGGRPSFKKKSFGPKKFSHGQGSFDAPRKLYTATCASCGNSCEVPFRPTGERPVYCRECFDKQGPQGFERREAPRHGVRPSFERRDSRMFERPDARMAPQPRNDRALEELTAQVQSLTHKLDRVLEQLAAIAAPAAPSAPARASLGNVVAKVAKKASKKKKSA